METNRYNHFTALKVKLCEEVLQITIENFSLKMIVEYIGELLHLIEILKEDQIVKVVVFHSTNSDFFLVNYYTSPKHENACSNVIDPLLFKLWVEVLMGLAVIPQTKVAIVEEKVRDAGNGFLLACDLTIHCTAAEVDGLSINL